MEEDFLESSLKEYLSTIILDDHSCINHNSFKLLTLNIVRYLFKKYTIDMVMNTICIRPRSLFRFLFNVFLFQNLPQNIFIININIVIPTITCLRHIMQKNSIIIPKKEDTFCNILN